MYFLSVFLSRLMTSFLQGYSLAEFLQDQSSQVSATTDPQGFNRQEAIWELFTSECVYFLDQLMVLKEVIVRTKPHVHKKTHHATNKIMDQTQTKHLFLCVFSSVDEFLSLRLLLVISIFYSRGLEM